MADLIVFKPRAEVDAEVNVSAFIALCRSKLTIFGADLDFECDGWDVTKSVALRARGKGLQRARFTHFNNENQILAEPFRCIESCRSECRGDGYVIRVGHRCHNVQSCGATRWRAIL